jgi:Na+-driven multidrug efflux pump
LDNVGLAGQIYFLYVFISSTLDIPAMGIRGAAISAVIARVTTGSI